MHPHHGMLAPHRLPSYEPTITLRPLRLWEPAMLRTQSLEQPADRLAQPAIRARLAHPRRVAAAVGWHGEQGQDCDTRGLVLIRHIRVEACRSELAKGRFAAIFVVRAEIDVVDVYMVLDVRTNRLQRHRPEDESQKRKRLNHHFSNRESEGNEEVKCLREHAVAQSTDQTPSASQCPRL
jgi:hypothetical protein